jgi:hypothetical protein
VVRDLIGTLQFTSRRKISGMEWRRQKSPKASRLDYEGAKRWLSEINQLAGPARFLLPVFVRVLR